MEATRACTRRTSTNDRSFSRRVVRNRGHPPHPAWPKFSASDECRIARLVGSKDQPRDGSVEGQNVHALVAGGPGYIGSHPAKALAASGIVPVVLDNLSPGHRSSVKWGPFVQ